MSFGGQRRETPGAPQGNQCLSDPMLSRNPAHRALRHSAKGFGITFATK
jgi:hypothetical protein